MRASHWEAPAGNWQVPGERCQGISFLFLPHSKATFLTEVPSLHDDGSLWTLRPPRLQLSLSSSNTVLSLYAFSPTDGNGFLLLLFLSVSASLVGLLHCPHPVIYVSSSEPLGSNLFAVLFC